MEKVCKSSSSKYAKIAGLHFQQGCSSVPVWCQLVRVKLSSARLSRFNPPTVFQLYEFDLKGFVLHVYIMTCHSCLHWLCIMWAFLFQRLATLIKSLSTADQTKNKFIKNRLPFGSRISHTCHFYFVMLLFLMLLFYICCFGEADFKQWVTFKPFPLIVLHSLLKVRDYLKMVYASSLSDLLCQPANNT